MMRCKGCSGSKCERVLEVPFVMTDRESREVVKYDHCPLRDITDLSWKMYELYYHYKNGFLEVDGGLNVQRSKYLSSVSVLDSAFARLEREDMKERKKGGK